MFVDLENLLRQRQEEYAWKTVRAQVKLSSGLGGELVLSRTGRDLEFFGVDGQYAASIVDDKHSFFAPTLLQRLGYWNEKSIVFDEQEVNPDGGLWTAPSIIQEIVKAYNQAHSLLYSEIWGDKYELEADNL